MPPQQVSSVRQALRPLCLYNGALGLGIIEGPGGRSWPKLSLVYIIGRSAVYMYYWWYGQRNLQPMHYNAIGVLITVVRLIHHINVGIAVISTILGFVNYKKMIRFARRITLADETLEIFGIEPDYESTLKDTKWAILVCCVGSFVIFSSDLGIACYLFDDYYDIVVRLLVFELPLILNLTIELNFSILISVLGKRFERLNALIQSLTSTSMQADNLRHRDKYQCILKKHQNKIAVQSNYYNKNRNNIELVLRTARQLHLDLCATSREVNDTFSKQLSLQMAASFLLLTGFGYCTYLVYNDVKASLAMKIQHFCSLGVWIATSVFRIIHVVRISVNVAAESQRTSQIAHEIQVSRWQKKIIDEIHQLSLQIMQHPLYFTASGLIVLDFGYVRGFVGSVTTYLMILIQNQPDMIKAANTLADVDTENATSKTFKY